MEDIKFFKTVIYSIINLLGYLLSIFFLSSLYYIKILSFYFNNDDEKEILNKQYKDIKITFIFHTFLFLGFIVNLFIMIYINSSNESENNKNNNHNNDRNSTLRNINNNNMRNNNNNINNWNNNDLNFRNFNDLTSNNEINNEINNIEGSNDNQNNNRINLNINSNFNEQKCYKINEIIMLIIFITCQFFYLLHLILISNNLRIFKDKIRNIFERKKFVIGIFKDILISGYIFFVIFLVIGIWVSILSTQRLNCLPNLNAETCSFLNNYFDRFIKNSPEQLKKDKIKNDVEIYKLTLKKTHLEREIKNQNLNSF